MTEAAGNQNGAATQTQDFQKLYETEHSHAQHFKSEAESARAAAKAALDEANRLKAENDSFKNSAALGDPKKLEERINQTKTEVEQEAQKRYGGKIGELEGKLTEAQKMIQKYEVVNPGLSKAAGIFLPDAMEFVQRALEESCVSVDGKIVVKGTDGKPKPSIKDPRVNMDLDEFLQEYAKKNPFLVQPQVRDGTMNGNTKSASTSNNADLPAGFSTWSQEQQPQWFAKNPEAAKSVLASAKF